MNSKNRIQNDEHYMQIALDAARAGLVAGEVPVGAVLVQGNEVIATAYNLTVTNNDPTAHAETLVLRKAASILNKPRLDGATLYVTVEPCTMCAGALLQARIQRLVFGAREAKTGAVVSIAETLMNSANTHRVSVSDGVMAFAATQLMQEFFANKR